MGRVSVVHAPHPSLRLSCKPPSSKENPATGRYARRGFRPLSKGLGGRQGNAPRQLRVRKHLSKELSGRANKPAGFAWVHWRLLCIPIRPIVRWVT
jgi:hypothetical protein